MKEGTAVRERHLYALGDLDGYYVASGNPDIRGWEVFGADSLRLGEVRELVVDVDAMKARYMVVALDRGVAGEGHERRVIVPVGRARLDDSLDRVYLHDVTLSTAPSLPVYHRDMLATDFERTLFGPGGKGGERYAGPEYDTGRFFGKRRTAADEAYLQAHPEARKGATGGTGFGKRVETEAFRQTVPVMHEEVIIERRPVPEGQGSTEVSITDEEVRVPILAEEAVVSKRVVVREEVVIRKTRVPGEQVVETELSRERFDVGAPSPGARGAEPTAVPSPTSAPSSTGVPTPAPGRQDLGPAQGPMRPDMGPSRVGEPMQEEPRERAAAKKEEEPL
jgi:uncharacterized protein (TIGR02271 family)